MKPTPIVLIIVLVVSGLGYAKWGDGKAVLIVKDCGESKPCVEAVLSPRIVLKVSKGVMPPKGSALHCAIGDGLLKCDGGLEAQADSVMLQVN